MPRESSREFLHPTFRGMVQELDRRLLDAGIPLRPYEGARSPVRQAELYARGRGVGETGKTVTRAKAWGSFHQYALAEDEVFFLDGKWSWEEPRAGMWQEFTGIARDLGLRTLSFERPHVEYPYPLASLQAGNYPRGGDATWERWLETAIENWGRDARTIGGIVHPGAPPMPTLEERPPLVFADGLPPSPFGA
jgi:hypothetical protein